MIETKYGNFELLKDEKDAFNIVKFEEKYLPEYFDKYQYMVGDLADDILRLKGFSADPKSPAYFHYIPDYIIEGCAYNCKYYILKRIKNGEKLENFNIEIGGTKTKEEISQKEKDINQQQKKKQNKNSPKNQVVKENNVKKQDVKQKTKEENSTIEETTTEKPKKKKYKKYYKKTGDKNERPSRNDNTGTNN